MTHAKTVLGHMDVNLAGILRYGGTDSEGLVESESVVRVGIPSPCGRVWEWARILPKK